MEKRKCTGRNCPFQYDRVDPALCAWQEACRFATFPATNGDCIRAMADEELAKFLTDMMAGSGDFYYKNLPECEAALDEDRDIPEESCEACMVDWLKSAAEVVDDGKDKTV